MIACIRPITLHVTFLEHIADKWIYRREHESAARRPLDGNPVIIFIGEKRYIVNKNVFATLLECGMTARTVRYREGGEIDREDILRRGTELLNISRHLFIHGAKNASSSHAGESHNTRDYRSRREKLKRGKNERRLIVHDKADTSDKYGLLVTRRAKVTEEPSTGAIYILQGGEAGSRSRSIFHAVCVFAESAQCISHAFSFPD